MDENKKEEFSLEDILKEFGIEKTEFTGDDDVRVWDGNVQPAQSAAVSTDTVRLDVITS